jgi:hypothetical protein
MKLRTKMIVGFLATSLLAGVIDVVGLISLGSITRADKFAFDTGTMGVAGTQEILAAFDAVKWRYGTRLSRPTTRGTRPPPTKPESRAWSRH